MFSLPVKREKKYLWSWKTVDKTQVTGFERYSYHPWSAVSVLLLIHWVFSHKLSRDLWKECVDTCQIVRQRHMEILEINSSECYFIVVTTLMGEEFNSITLGQTAAKLLRGRKKWKLMKRELLFNKQQFTFSTLALSQFPLLHLNFNTRPGFLSKHCTLSFQADTTYISTYTLNLIHSLCTFSVMPGWLAG